jgi:hypothetical protein
MSQIRYLKGSRVRYPGVDRRPHRGHANAAYPACPLCIVERTSRMYGTAR